MTTNKAACGESGRILQAYVEAKGEDYEASSSEICDLIADLLHLTVRLDQGHDPIESTMRLARMHFDAEHENPEEEEGTQAVGEDSRSSIIKAHSIGKSTSFIEPERNSVQNSLCWYRLGFAPL